MGTTMYCPKCGELADCAVCSNAYSSKRSKSVSSKGLQVHYFIRNRWCSNCQRYFDTVEIDENILRDYLSIADNVLEMRDLLDRGFSTITEALDCTKQLTELVRKVSETVNKHSERELQARQQHTDTEETKTVLKKNLTKEDSQGLLL